MVRTNGTWFWLARAITAVLFVPIPGAVECDSCPLTNVTVTGGVLLSLDVVPPQLSSNGTLVVMDCLLLQTLGATQASVMFGAPCLSLTAVVDFPELIGLTIATARDIPSSVRLCWNSRTNTMYQAQYSSDLSPQTWENLGDPMPGTGSTNCFNEIAAPPHRFYRVTVPQ